MTTTGSTMRRKQTAGAADAGAAPNPRAPTTRRSAPAAPRTHAAAAPAARRAIHADPRELGAPERWDARLAACAALGFDALVLGAPFAHEPGEPALIADYERCDAS
ncbi:MAG TPA: hypothetical protein VGC30_02485, partial [Dokdonella sp.]